MSDSKPEIPTPDELDRIIAESWDAPSPETPPEKHVPTASEMRDRAELEKAREEREKQKRQDRRESDRQARDSLWVQGIPVVFRDAKIEALPESIAFACQKWLDKPADSRWTLIIFGPVGVGKSFAAYAVARELFLERQDVEICEVQSMVDSFKPNNDDHAQVFARVNNVENLFLEDLGKERATDFSADRIDMLLDTRWQNQLPTVITTNVSPGSFPELLGARTASRLLGGATLVKYSGKDRRLN